MPTSGDITKKRRLCITGIALDYIGGGEAEEEPGALMGLFLFGVEGHRNWKHVSLSQTSPWRWTVDDMLEVAENLDGIYCVVRDRGGSDIGFANLLCRTQHEAETTLSPQEPFALTTHEVRTSGNIPLQITWRIAEFMLDGNWITVEAVSTRDSHTGLVPIPDSTFVGDRDIAYHVLVAFNVVQLAQVLRSISTLDMAISIMRCILSVTQPGHPLHPVNSVRLGAYLCVRYLWINDLCDLDKAITALSMGLESAHRGCPDFSVVSRTIASLCHDGYMRTGELPFLDKAVMSFQKALLPVCRSMVRSPVSTVQAVAEVTASSGHAALASLMWFARVLLLRYKASGAASDASDVVTIYRKCLELTPPWHSSVPEIVSGLGKALALCYEESGDLPDIDEVLALNRRSVSLSLGRDPDPMLALGRAFYMRFQHTGIRSDIDGAIDSYRAALQLMHPSSDTVPLVLTELGFSLSTRLRVFGDLEDGAEAISLLHKAAGKLSRNPKGLAFCLENLAVSFFNRFDVTKDEIDLSKAIATIRRALKLDNQARPRRLSILGTILGLRLDHLAQDEAVTVSKEAVSLTCKSDLMLPTLLTNLGAILIRRARLMDAPADIDTAIEVLEEAVSLTREGDAELPWRLSYLAQALDFRTYVPVFGSLGLKKCCHDQEFGWKDVGHEPPEGLHPLKVIAALHANGKYQGVLEDNGRAVKLLEEAVSMAPEGHAGLFTHLTRLGSVFHLRFVLSGNFLYQELSGSAFERALMCSSGSPIGRLNTAQKWAGVFSSMHPSHKIVTIPAYSTAMDMLALVAGLERSVEARHSKLREASALPLQAAEAARQLGRLDKAIEWLEQGRCHVWRQLTGLRSPLDTLHSHSPHLAERVTRLSRLLGDDSGISRQRTDMGLTHPEHISLHDEARSRLQLTRQWEALLVEVRAIPKFGNFLKPTPYSMIQGCLPEDGPIIVINIHNKCCSAFALIRDLDEPLEIPLPGTSLKGLMKYQKEFSLHLRNNALRVRSSGGGDPEDVRHQQSPHRAIARYCRTWQGSSDITRNVLKQLWLEIVKPILTALAFPSLKGSPQGSLPRIWWCPTGPLSFLPLHAAGIYDETGSESLSDYVVSSYTPTVTALTDRAEVGGTRHRANCGLLLTSQPSPPAASRIPGTTKEVTSIHGRAISHGVRALKFDGDELSAEDCLERLGEFSCVHFACHASQNASEPLQSRFLFHKGRLTLRSIMQKDLKHADLAFLSACQTGTGDSTLPEEAVHLAAGMLAAGYRRVVATIWSINDSYAPDVAKDFYEYLWTHRDDASGSYFDGSLSAHALHHAIQNLRRRLKGDQEEALLAWVPYVHFGY